MRSKPRTVGPWLVGPVLAAMLALPVSAAAGTLEQTVPFQIGRWVELDHVEGPITLHRIRLGELRSLKDNEYQQTFEVELEYSNASKKDWISHVHIEWKDSDGKVIDGSRFKKDLDDGSNLKHWMVKVTTLRYGIQKAKTLALRIELEED